MYTQAALLDLHERCHRTLSKLLEHCRRLEPDALDREQPGFGYPTVRLQLHHVIGAEEYWMGVIQGSFQVEDDDWKYPTVASLEEYRQRTARVTRDWLRRTPDAELNTAREMLTWRGDRPLLVPAHVLLRTQTHIYHHQGQVLALCRLLNHPVPPNLVNFPLD